MSGSVSLRGLGDHILPWLTRKGFPVDEPPREVEPKDEAAHRADDEAGNAGAVEATAG